MLAETTEARGSSTLQGALDDSDAESDISDTKRNQSSSSKRKRDDAPELEIDVSLPEPPSKRAQRKAKKQKTGTAKASEGGIAKESAQNVDDDATKSADVSKSSKRSQFGIWIGNLVFTITKALLEQFLTSSSTDITSDHITRIHIPAPKHASATKTTLKPENKGFAYVDFTDAETLEAALKLSETEFAGRRVLIKDAKNFEGRPDKPKDEEDSKDTKSTNAKTSKAPSKRVFVGNLSFDVTKEDLSNHFKQCGEVENVHVATFEDSGKCKGFAWITFLDIEAAEAAVRGWIRKKDDDQLEDSDENDGTIKEGDQISESRPKNREKKGRKWFVNRLFGRPLRCEFAEDPSVRYRKRFGKGKDVAPGDGGTHIDDESQPQQERQSMSTTGSSRGAPRDYREDGRIAPGAPTDPAKRRGRQRNENPNTSKANGEYKSNEETRYRTGGITAGTGTKTTFE